jgi:hypothetical protein
MITAAASTETMVTPPISLAELTAQVATVVETMWTAYHALPLDEDLSTPRMVAANDARRSVLIHYVSRLPMELQRVREWEPKVTMLHDWIDTCRACLQDLRAQLTAMETAEQEKTDPRAGQKVTQLRQSLADVAHGPDLVGSGECMTDTLVAWFADHHISALPGEMGIFSGRGGLHSAVARHEEAQRALALARAEVAHTLRAAQQQLP